MPAPSRSAPAISPPRRPPPSPVTLHAIADAFSGDAVSPVVFLGRALVGALAEEVRTLGGLREVSSG